LNVHFLLLNGNPNTPIEVQGWRIRKFNKVQTTGERKET